MCWNTFGYLGNGALWGNLFCYAAWNCWEYMYNRFASMRTASTPRQWGTETPRHTHSCAYIALLYFGYRQEPTCSLSHTSRNLIQTAAIFAYDRSLPRALIWTLYGHLYYQYSKLHTPLCLLCGCTFAHDSSCPGNTVFLPPSLTRRSFYRCKSMLQRYNPSMETVATQYLARVNEAKAWLTCERPCTFCLNCGLSRSVLESSMATMIYPLACLEFLHCV